MRVAVVGGTGTLGRRVVAELAELGDDVRAVSRSPRAMRSGVSHHRADSNTGEGLPEALGGVEVVIDASNARKEAQDVLVDGTRRLLQAEEEAGVGHHVVVSIVGCDRVPMAYYDAKVAQLPVRVPMVGGLGRALREGGLCKPGAAATGTRTFEDWLRDG